LRIKTVWTVHNINTHNSSSSVNTFYRVVSALVSSLITHSASGALTISNAYLVSKNKVYFIPHGCYPCAFDVKPFLPNNFTPSSPLRMLYFGHVSPYKGLDLICSALHSLSERIGDLTPNVTIVGQFNSSKYPVLDQQLRSCSKIRLVPGFVDNHQLNRYLELADLVILPFRDTFTSGSLIYALSAGKPVLISDIDSLAFYLSPSFSFTFEAGNVTSLIHALDNISMAHSCQSLQIMGQSARHFAKTLDWNAIAYKTVDIYSSPPTA
jgi:glycosyltransferase involved in cell wall biosynthesis